MLDSAYSEFVLRESQVRLDLPKRVVITECPGAKKSKRFSWRVDQKVDDTPTPWIICSRIVGGFGSIDDAKGEAKSEMEAEIAARTWLIKVEAKIRQEQREDKFREDSKVVIEL